MIQQLEKNGLKLIKGTRRIIFFILFVKLKKKMNQVCYNFKVDFRRDVRAIWFQNKVHQTID
jgi:hypothetical protein